MELTISEHLRITLTFRHVAQVESPKQTVDSLQGSLHSLNEPLKLLLWDNSAFRVTLFGVIGSLDSS